MFMDVLGYGVLHIPNLRTLRILCMWCFTKWVFIYLFGTLHVSDPCVFYSIFYFKNREDNSLLFKLIVKYFYHSF